MDKFARVMFKHIMDGFHRLTSIDADHEKRILDELARVKGGGIAKKKEGAVDVISEEKDLKN